MHLMAEFGPSISSQISIATDLNIGGKRQRLSDGYEQVLPESRGR